MYDEETETDVVNDWYEDDDNPFISYGEGYEEDLKKQAFGEEE